MAAHRIRITLVRSPIAHGFIRRLDMKIEEVKVLDCFESIASLGFIVRIEITGSTRYIYYFHPGTPRNSF